MAISIKQKIEGSKKKIIVTQKLNSMETTILFLFLMLLLIPYCWTYLNNPDRFFSNVNDVIFFAISIIILIFLFFLKFLSRVYIIKDMSDGSIQLQQKFFMHESFVFNKDENPILKLVKLPLYYSLFTKRIFVLSIVTNNRKIAVDFDMKRKWLYLFDTDHEIWLFSKEDARNISDFLDISLSSEIEGEN